MSRTVEIPAQPVPLQVLLILSICMICLLVHFCGENLALSAHAFSLELNISGEINDKNHDSGEDSYILPEFTIPKVMRNSIRAICPVLLVFAPISFRPLYPPPIAG
jgi:hypothetical protein